MTTKSDLEKQVDSLSALLQEERRKYNTAQGNYDRERERVKQLKHSIARLEQENGRLNGYIDRVVQEDNAKFIAENGLQGVEGYPKEPFQRVCADHSFTEVFDDVGFNRREEKIWYEV